MYRLIIVDDEPVNFYSIHHVVDWQLAYLLGSLTLNHLKISRKARNGFIFCQI